MSHGAERWRATTARRLAGYKNSAHVSFFDISAWAVARARPYLRDTLLTCLAPLAACNPDTVEEVKAVEARDMSILGSRAKQTLFSYRYCFDVTRPVPYMSQGKLDATLEV